jgi:DNA (cytosine-5)-methyltransferase 1
MLELWAPATSFVRRKSKTDAATLAGDSRRTKLQRLRLGGSPRVMDLFSGCGGMSLGFSAAGFSLSGAVEVDPIAAESHALNFYRSETWQARANHALPRDITTTPPELLTRELNLGATPDCIDVLVGGPPCQAFARVGRAKLREIAEHPEAFKHDGRAKLYISFMEYVSALQPIAVVMENVPDVMNFGGHNISEEMCEALEAKGYVARYALLNSARYGVPQMRERMFLIAYARELGAIPTFPDPTHWHELPRGYEGTRQVAFRSVTDLFGSGVHVCPTPEPISGLPSAVTAREALDDLPRITLHLEGKLRRGARRFTDWIPYPEGAPLSEYATLMRTWPRFSSNGGLYDHVIRYLPRDYAIFRRMKPGDQYPEAYELALRMLEEAVDTQLGSQASAAERLALREKLRAAVVPPYDHTKFPNKWRKMEADAPARTLMAHLGKDGYSHIHYDSSQARTISVREAARLQSFPDGFRFCGTMNPAFRQIGNAVPPLMAKAIASAIGKELLARG